MRDGMTRLGVLLGVTTLVSVGCPAAPPTTVVSDPTGTVKASKLPVPSKLPTTIPSTTATAFGVPTAGPSLTPTPGSSSSPEGTPTPGASPTDGTTPSPETSPGSEPTPVPTPRPTYSPGGPEVVAGELNSDGKTTITGKIFDIDGTQMTGFANATFSYKGEETKVQLDNGAFQFTNVPLESGIATITVSKYGYTTRKRTFFLEPGRAHMVNFGEPGKFDHPYFLSSYPEIIDVEPVDGLEDRENTPITLKITLSEALDSENRNNFIHSLRVVPLNEVSAKGATPPPDLNGATGTAVTLDAYPYHVAWPTPRPSGEDISDLLDIPTWDQAIIVSCQKITNALTGRSKGGAYQIGLVNDPAHEIRDPEGNRMGTSGNGKLDTTVSANEFLFNTVRSPKLGISGFDAASRDTRWDSTHTNAATFTLKTDNDPPKPVSVTCKAVPASDADENDLVSGLVGRQGQAYTEFEIQFDTDLVVFGPRAGSTAKRNALTWDESIEKLENFTFAVGQSQAALEPTFLDGKTNVLTVLSSRKGFGNSAAEWGKEFRIQSTQECPVTVSFRPLASSGIRVIRIWNNSEFFDNQADVVSVKVRAGGIVDPAGNVMTSAVSDLPANQKMVDIAYPAPPPSADPAAYRLQHVGSKTKRRRR